MPNTTGIDIDLSDLEALIESVIATGEREAAPTLAEAIRLDTIERASRGVSYVESSWQPYTERYAKRRKKMGLQTFRVDHRVTGMMLGSYQFNESSQMLTVPDELSGQAEGTANLRNWIEPSQTAVDAGCIELAKKMEAVDSFSRVTT